MSDEKKDKPRIDADYSPSSYHNKEQARKLNWKYDNKNKVYRDSNGDRIADKFGQPL